MKVERGSKAGDGMNIIQLEVKRIKAGGFSSLVFCICGSKLRGLEIDYGGACDYDLGFFCDACGRAYSYDEAGVLGDLFKIYAGDYGCGHEMEWSKWLKDIRKITVKKVMKNPPKWLTDPNFKGGTIYNIQKEEK